MDRILLILWLISFAILVGRKISYGHLFLRNGDPKPNFLFFFYIKKSRKSK